MTGLSRLSTARTHQIITDAIERSDAGALTLGVLGLPFERAGYGVNKPAAWSRLYGGVGRGYIRDFGWRAAFLGGGCE